MPRQTLVHKREKLYREVWSAPVRQVARRYGVSDVGLAKICRRLSVPLPPRGYWSRKAAGQHVDPKQLPPLRAGDVAEYRVERTALPQRSVRSPEAGRLLAREQEEEMQVRVEPELTSPHPLIRRYAGRLSKNAKEKQPQPLPSQRETASPHIMATGEALERVLRIMDALLKAFDRRGFLVEIIGPKKKSVGRQWYSTSETVPSTTAVEILGSRVELAIAELSHVIEAPSDSRSRQQSSVRTELPTPVRRPGGKLALKIANDHRWGGRVTWADGKKQRVENCLNEFIVSLIHIAEHRRLARERAQRLKREEFKQARKQEKERRRQEYQACLIFDLDSRVSDWRRARTIRKFLSAVEDDAKGSNNDVSPESDLGRWLAWAHRHADSLENEAVQTAVDLRQPAPWRNDGDEE